MPGRRGLLRRRGSGVVLVVPGVQGLGVVARRPVEERWGEGWEVRPNGKLDLRTVGWRSRSLELGLRRCRGGGGGD